MTAFCSTSRQASTFSFSIADLPLVVENGYRAAELMDGVAEISYDRNGEWCIESISFEGVRKNHYSLEEMYSAAAHKRPLDYWSRKQVALDATTPIHSIIVHRLENEWKSNVDQAVAEEMEGQHVSAADDRADARRDAMMTGEV